MEPKYLEAPYTLSNDDRYPSCMESLGKGFQVVPIKKTIHELLREGVSVYLNISSSCKGSLKISADAVGGTAFLADVVFLAVVFFGLEAESEKMSSARENYILR